MKQRFILFFALCTLHFALCSLPVFAQSCGQPGGVCFPDAVDTEDALFRTANGSTTTLTATLGSSATTATVVSTSKFPSSGALQSGTEIFYYTAKTSTTFTGLIRAMEGTTAASHAINATVRSPILASQHNALGSSLYHAELKLGSGNSTPAPNKFLVGSGAGTSGWRNLTNADITTGLGYDPRSLILAINVKDYNASGSITTTTTGGSTSAGSSTVTLTSVSTFSVGQGIAIVGAGTSGAFHVGTITAISGSVVTFSPATATTVSSGAIVKHDDTFAIRNAVVAAHAQRTAKVRMPAGFYRVNAPKEGNFVLNLPNVASAPGIQYESLEIEGEAQPVLMFGTVPNTNDPYPTSGTIIQSDDTGGAIIGTQYAGNFAGLHVTLRNLSVRSYDNPNITAADLSLAAWAGVYNCVFDTGFYTLNEAQPTHSTAYGLITPATSNGAFTVVRDSLFQGYYKGLIAHEHTVGDNIQVSGNIVGLSIEGGLSHAIWFGRVLAQNNQINLDAHDQGGGSFTIQQMAIEHPNHLGLNGNPAWQYPVWDIYDPSGISDGTVNVLFTEGYVSQQSGENFLRSGAAKIAVTFMNSTVKSPAVVLHRATGDVSIADDSFTSIPFTSEEAGTGDLYNMHSNTVNPSQITITETGLYLFTGIVSYDVNASGFRACRIISGSNTIAFSTALGMATGNSRPTCSGIATLTAGSTVTLDAYSFGGGTILVKTDSNFPRFSAVRIK